jgi:hypothetical protein
MEKALFSNIKAKLRKILVEIKIIVIYTKSLLAYNINRNGIATKLLPNPVNPLMNPADKAIKIK